MVVPSPSINKRLRLRAVFLSDVVVNLIVIALGIKRRVNITKVNRFVADEFPQNVEVVAVKEFVHSAKLLSKNCLAVNDTAIMTIMKVFLSHASSPFDIAFASRLRAVALGYDVELLLPDALHRQFVTPATKKKIKDSAAVIALITAYSALIEAVNLELQEAKKQNKPIIAFVEHRNLIQGLPPEQVVVFQRSFKEMGENQLFNVVRTIASKRNQEELGQTLAALGLGVLTLLALGELIKEK